MSKPLFEGLKQVKVLIDLRKFDHALKVLGELTSVYPESSEVWFYIGLVYFHKEDFTRSRSAARECLKLDAQSMSCHNLLGAIYLKRFNTNLAKIHLKEALMMAPQNVVVLSNMSRLAILEKDFLKAKDYAEQGLELDPTCEDCLNNLFWAYKLQGKEEKAAEMLEISLKNNPENVQTLVGLGHDCYSKHKFREAKEVFESVLKWNSDFLPALKGLKISVSADYWFTRSLLKRPVLHSLHMLLMLCSVILVYKAGVVDDDLKGFLFIPLLMILVMTIPVFGMAVGRVFTFIFRHRYRHLFFREELFFAMIILLLFAVSIFALSVQAANLFYDEPLNAGGLALSFTSSLLVVSSGFRMEVAQPRQLLKDFLIVWITGLSVAVTCTRHDLQLGLLVVLIISWFFDELVCRGQFRVKSQLK
jgi:hypothetical protein